jgi:hypothetical protein
MYGQAEVLFESDAFRVFVSNIDFRLFQYEYITLVDEARIEPKVAKFFQFASCSLTDKLNSDVAVNGRPHTINVVTFNGRLAVFFGTRSRRRFAYNIIVHLNYN